MIAGYPYKVQFTFRKQDTLKNLSAWCDENCTGKHIYQYTALFFHFQKSEDAMMFRLANNL